MSMKWIQGALLACVAVLLLSGEALAEELTCTSGELGVSTGVEEGVEGGVGNRVSFIEEQVTVECRKGRFVTFSVKIGGVNPADEALIAVQRQQLKNILSMALIAQTQPEVKVMVNTDPSVFEFVVLGKDLD